MTSKALDTCHGWLAFLLCTSQITRIGVGALSLGKGPYLMQHQAIMNRVTSQGSILRFNHIRLDEPPLPDPTDREP